MTLTLDTALATKVLNFCITTGSKLKNGDVQKRILMNQEKILRKMDVLILRDLNSANITLDDIKSTGATDPNELLMLRERYRKNIGIPMNGETNGIRNAQIILMSYLGMFQIGILLGEDPQRLVRYVLHMFATGEEIVALDLFPEFYCEFFAQEHIASSRLYRTRMENWTAEEDIISLYSQYCAKRTFRGNNPVGALLLMKDTDIEMLSQLPARSCKEFVWGYLALECEKDKLMRSTQKAIALLSE